MARPSSKSPPDLELEILKVLWRDGPLPVRDVQEALTPQRKLAYTSVMTMMTIMTEKGYLRREKKGRSFVYRPTVTEKATSRRMLRDLVERVFSGSPMAVVLNLLETADLGDEELEELRRMIGRKTGRRSK